MVNPRFSDPEAVDEAVYRVIEAVPPGRVTSYGAVAEIIGLSTPRRPAGAMRKAPEGLTWWRIVRGDGTMTAPLFARGRAHWDAEGTPRDEDRIHRSAFWKPTAAELDTLQLRLDEVLGVPASEPESPSDSPAAD
ncbi:MGMT family protein [Galactobacter caseinivorans]|uniref:MGMT family protein n=1 Tax=Galactobacter caseinivorans TaxID=2676123 RepID=UPI0013144922|nr:MGMT family protein [Galactobacter caseinivorans]